MSKLHAQVQIDVTIQDLPELKAYALKRALDIGMTEAEFNEGECDDPEGNISYWLGWAFDAGTPEHCGFQIESSHVEEYYEEDEIVEPEDQSQGDIEGVDNEREQP